MKVSDIIDRFDVNDLIDKSALSAVGIECSRMKLGYNTNGLAHHDSGEAIALVAETGYEFLGLTIDHHWLSPRSATARADARTMGNLLRHAGLGSVLETGARFLLDPRRKHWPPLVAPRETAAPRVQFIRYALEVAAELGSHCVSIWSGAALPGATQQQSLDWLAINLEPVLAAADELAVDIGFEPEPGMFVETLGGFERLRQWLDHPRLKLTLDIGHLFCMGEVPLGDHIRRCAPSTVNVHIEDMRAGVHDHLLFGEGDIHFPPVIEALRESGYGGPVCVELSRHSHDAARALRHSWDFLAPLVCPDRHARFSNSARSD